MIRINRTSVALATALVLSSAVAPALAQTAMQPPGARNRVTPNSPPKQAQAQNQVQAQKSQRPITESMINDAQDHAEGFYPDMVRSGVGGQIQNAWSMSKPRDGVHKFRICEDCVYKIRTREFMATTILLPTDAEILSADLGDRRGFHVTVNARNMLTVRPSTYGIDTNLNVYTKSGAVYPFYVQAHSFNSIHVPDLLVKFLSQETPNEVQNLIKYAPPEGENGKEERHPRSGKSKDKKDAAIKGLTAPNAPANDFVRSIEFDPAKLHGWNDYKLWGDKELRPETVFRDDQFTYIQYGDKWDSMELPVGYVVVDGIDEVVNTRVQGSTFIIESTHKLISLKSGKKFLCIEYTGEDA